MTESETPPQPSKPPAGFYPDGSGKTRWWDGNDWTEHYQDAAPAATQVTATAEAPPKKKKRRVFLWVFMAIQILFLIWVIAGASSGAGSPDDCGVLDAKTCNDASDVGTGIGVAIVIFFWMVVDVILGVSYAIYRLAKRN